MTLDSALALFAAMPAADQHTILQEAKISPSDFGYHSNIRFLRETSSQVTYLFMRDSL
jgi:hypothetical protein